MSQDGQFLPVPKIRNSGHYSSWGPSTRQGYSVPPSAPSHKYFTFYRTSEDSPAIMHPRNIANPLSLVGGSASKTTNQAPRMVSSPRVKAVRSEITSPATFSPEIYQHGPSPLPATRQILFYHKHDPYYEFTNFSPFPVIYDGKEYPTAEHLFQSFKV